MKRDLVFERDYPHPPERVWFALTNREALANWFTENTFEPVVGHRFYFRSDPVEPDFDGYLHCEVTECNPPYRLAYTFIGGTMQNTTVVTFILTPTGDGTHLRLEHTGFSGLHDVAVAKILEGGWGTALRKLPDVLTSLESS